MEETKEGKRVGKRGEKTLGVMRKRRSRRRSERRKDRKGEREAR